ncbi:hypothetical protein LTR91_019135 [Friedmanniomyces endolithicus]|uniref:WLM domain-containing protein n=1 Tax=Friedmanniomyces endolithicus TaxID=329885 RepID=A0AAN6K554_9PEZI|nr:hypothetical protein LTR91_019135 [Friedmanniomyces endolithicus]KAK0980400.1 hypothetical protein LTS01_012088 [Friedmanniomyces endolithicus]KAK1023038.1 hypothetical protein LTS16_025233 [Friedmanniomyces endolithicus]
MPLGFERINERQSRPNASINFIKPDVRQSAADQAIAQDFLSRIAAQCYPVMKANYVSVMSLEEYPPNPEFLGRNFNAGECIQLVLKDKGGKWLSFKFVQMVMMHELAHCKQMNHSRFFWNVRNDYAKQMEGLWAKGYHGEGLWGRGKDLASGAFTSDRMPDDVQIPEHLCGGTYRRARGKKRKRGGEDEQGEKPKLSYAERQQKRIARKFGKHGDGNAIGEDELVRGALDTKRHIGKPKVAKSKRGRDLRANAALARFEAAKAQTPERTPELEDDGSETESGWSSADDFQSGQSTESKGTIGQVKDRKKGNDMVRVCGDEGEDEDGGGEEMEELRVLSGKRKDPAEQAPLPAAAKSLQRTPWSEAVGDDSETESDATEENQEQRREPAGGDIGVLRAESVTSAPRDRPPVDPPDSTTLVPEASQDGAPQQPSAAACSTSTMNCPICSLENERSAPICIACSHVLKPALMKDHWRCISETCAGSKYINAGDVGRCGVCSAQKPAKTSSTKGDGRPMGLISGDVLRWD